MDPYEQFTEVYSISDLHLTVGGNVDTIGVAALASSITALKDRANAATPRSRAALVINGDIVDFLDIDVEKKTYFDPLGAPSKLYRVFDANKAFWDELSKFSQVGTVVLTLGNHDIELAMPTCQAMLRARIPGRLVLAFDGAGYRCRIGNTTALFVHGNNEDPWNVVDYDRLGQIAASINAGMPYEAWEPNEGTKLVIDLLNEQKAQHPFIEYVKPEKGWLFELIAKLGFGSLTRQYAKLAPRQFVASARYAWRGRTAQAAYLGEASAASGATLFDADQLLLQADKRYRNGEQVLAAGDVGAGTLGLKEWISSKRVDPEEIRAHILKSLVGDTTFISAQGDDIYDRLRPKLGAEIHWVVCGHTHLRRALEDRPQRRVYFNSGTWMRLLDLYAATEADVLQVLKGLDAASRTELDDITWTNGPVPRPLVLREQTVVMFQAHAKGASGWLADAPALTEVTGSRWTVTP